MSFIEPGVELIRSLIMTVNYPGVAFLMALDATILPVPSAVVMGFAGYLCYEGSLDLALVVLAGAVGSTVGSLAMYFLGLWGGRPFLDRFGMYIGLKEKQISAAEGWFNKYGTWAVFLCQLLPILRDLIPFPAGVTRMKVGRFALLSLLGSIPFCLALASLGFLSGPAWESAVEVVDRYDVVVLIALAAVLVGYVIYRWLRKWSVGRSSQGR